MKDELISINTAILAKELSYSIGSKNCYIQYKKDFSYNNEKNKYKKGYVEIQKVFYIVNKGLGDFSNKSYNLYEAPTQSLLQKWIREVHHLFISVHIGFGEKTWYSVMIEDTTNPDIILDLQNSWTTYEEALEEGIFQALKLIKNEIRNKERK